jgi:murein DD-endopeptidase MepM/ murein hydrolase activator NlpD
VPNGFKVSPYGMRRHPIARVRRHHKGIDYAAPMDTVVHAAADGVVTEARYYGPLGRVVVVEHGRGLVTRYAHLNRYAEGVRPGTFVKRGDPIGHIGTTGLSTGAHLHFETLIDDEHVNPARVSTPPPPVITDDLLPQFHKHVADLLKQLDLSRSTENES